MASEGLADEARRSQGNHGYQTRAAMEETSRQSAEAADEDESTSEVGAPAPCDREACFNPSGRVQSGCCVSALRA